MVLGRPAAAPGRRHGGREVTCVPYGTRAACGPTPVPVPAPGPRPRFNVPFYRVVEVYPSYTYDRRTRSGKPPRCFRFRGGNGGLLDDAAGPVGRRPPPEGSNRTIACTPTPARGLRRTFRGDICSRGRLITQPPPAGSCRTGAERTSGGRSRLPCVLAPLMRGVSTHDHPDNLSWRHEMRSIRAASPAASCSYHPVI